MSWNPIEFSYKVYPESGRATFVSHMCSYIERLLVIFGIICAIFGYWRGIVCGAVMLGVAYLIHIKKDDWCKNIIKKEFANTNPKNSFVAQNPPLAIVPKLRTNFVRNVARPIPERLSSVENAEISFSSKL